MVGAAATDSITDAPDLSANGTNAVPLLAPWSNVGATASALETALGVREPCVWHKFYVPFAGTVVVTDNPPQFGDSHVPAAGDTYLYAYWSATGTLTDASPVTALTAIASDDDSGGQTKGYLTWADPGGRWIYIAHGPFSNGAQFTNQWTFVNVVSSSLDLGTAAVSLDPSLTAQPPLAWTWYSQLWGGAWACDTGVYAGPNPPVAPATLPGPCTELDYVVATGVAAWGKPWTSLLSDPYTWLDDSTGLAVAEQDTPYGPGYPADAHYFLVWSPVYGELDSTPPYLTPEQMVAGEPWPGPPWDDATARASIRLRLPMAADRDVDLGLASIIVQADLWGDIPTVSGDWTYQSWTNAWVLGAVGPPFTGPAPVPPLTLPFSGDGQLEYRVVTGPPTTQYGTRYPFTDQLSYCDTYRNGGAVTTDVLQVYGGVYPADARLLISWWKTSPDNPPFLGREAMLAGEPWPWDGNLGAAGLVLPVGLGATFPDVDLGAAGLVLTVGTNATVDPGVLDLGAALVTLQTAPSALTPARGSLGEPYFVLVDGSESYDLRLCPFDASPPIVIGDPFAPSMWLSMKPMSDGILTVTMDAAFDAEMEAWVGPDYTDAPKFVRLIAWTGSEPVELTPAPLVIGFGMIADTADEAARLTDALVLSATMILV